MKKNKRGKQSPNIVIFLVEGKSDQIALEIPITEIITDKNPDYEVRFILQQRCVNRIGEEVEDNDEEDDYVPEVEYAYGGDITTSNFVTPENIEIKITNRFIKPITRTEGIYPKRIARIIHVVDLDGAYIPDDRIVQFSTMESGWDRLYYNDINRTIETLNIDAVRKRNEHKRRNLDYLISLSDRGIKIGTKTIPYEVYYFSSNLDHFIHHNANLKDSKCKRADEFVRKYGLDKNKFCEFFFEDSASLGNLGYKESWKMVKRECNSVRRYTNIDYLMRKMMDL